MLSKPTLRKMLQDVSAPVLVEITIDLLGQLRDLPEGDGYQDMLGNVELAVAELKKKTAVKPPPRPKKNETPPPIVIGSGPQT